MANKNNLIRRARSGNVEAMYVLANLYVSEGNVKLAISWYKQAVEKGHGESAFELFKIYRKDGNIEMSEHYLKIAADSNIDEAQFVFALTCSLLAEYLKTLRLDQKYHLDFANEIKSKPLDLAGDYLARAFANNNIMAKFVSAQLILNQAGLLKDLSRLRKLQMEVSALRNLNFMNIQLKGLQNLN